MNEKQAKKVIDALEKAEKLANSRPQLPKELLPSYLKLIDYIYQLSKEGDVRVSDLSKALHQTAPSITRSLSHMEELGYITKTISSSDKRVVYVSLTELGLKLYQQYVEKYYKKLSKRLSKYNMDQIHLMISTIDEIYDDLMNDPISMEEKK